MILTHYYHKDDFPFQSLLCLSEEEAFLLQPRLNPLLSAGLSLFECCVMSAIPNLHFNNAVVGSLQMLLAAFTGKSIGCYNVFNLLIGENLTVIRLAVGPSSLLMGNAITNHAVRVGK